MKTKTKSPPPKDLTPQVEHIIRELEDQGYEFLKYTNDHVYAINNSWYCHINDLEDLRELLDIKFLLRSPWNAERRHIGKAVQEQISRLARKPKCESVRWEDIPEDLTIPEDERLVHRIRTYLTTCYDRNHTKGH